MRTRTKLTGNGKDVTDRLIAQRKYTASERYELNVLYHEYPFTSPRYQNVIMQFSSSTAR
tara:strand:- start:2141 stop:2320 length:180 start_codon:yes stop_codon:yes gene_type:complete